MMSEEELVAILTNNPEACSIELEVFGALDTTPVQLEKITGRSFDVEAFVLPDMNGGLATIVQIVRFKPKGSA